MSDDVHEELRRLRAERAQQAADAKEAAACAERQLAAIYAATIPALVDVLRTQLPPIPFYKFVKDKRIDPFWGRGAFRIRRYLQDTGASGWYLGGYILLTTAGVPYYAPKKDETDKDDRGLRRGPGYVVSGPIVDMLDGHMRDELTNSGEPLTPRQIAALADRAIAINAPFDG
jgi:hypothetical protein